MSTETMRLIRDGRRWERRYGGVHKTVNMVLNVYRNHEAY